MGKDHLIKKKKKKRYSKCPQLIGTFICLFPPNPCVFANGSTKSLFMQVRCLGLLDILCVYIQPVSTFFQCSLKYLSNLFSFYLHLLTLLQAFIIPCLYQGPLNWFPHIYSYLLLATMKVIFSNHIIHHVTRNLYLTLVPCPTLAPLFKILQ